MARRGTGPGITLELIELARSAGAEIAGTVFQVRETADPATLVGAASWMKSAPKATAHKSAAHHIRQQPLSHAAAQHRTSD